MENNIRSKCSWFGRIAATDIFVANEEIKLSKTSIPVNNIFIALSDTEGSLLIIRNLNTCVLEFLKLYARCFYGGISYLNPKRNEDKKQFVALYHSLESLSVSGANSTLEDLTENFTVDASFSDLSEFNQKVLKAYNSYIHSEYEANLHPKPLESMTCEAIVTCSLGELIIYGAQELVPEYTPVLKEFVEHELISPIMEFITVSPIGYYPESYFDKKYNATR